MITGSRQLNMVKKKCISLKYIIPFPLFNIQYFQNLKSKIQHLTFNITHNAKTPPDPF